MTWQLGLILWLAGGLAVMWIWAEIAERFSRPSDDWDSVADRKRRIERRAKKLSGEHQ